MIENDEQFQEVLKEYAKSKGVEYDDFCRDIACEDCIFGKLGLYCTSEPFKEIEEYYEKIKELKQEVSIMWNWKKNRKIENKLKDFCKTFRSGTNLSDLTCCGISCDKCLFHDMDNFKEWARKAKEESIGEDE